MQLASFSKLIGCTFQIFEDQRGAIYGKQLRWTTLKYGEEKTSKYGVCGSHAPDTIYFQSLVLENFEVDLVVVRCMSSPN